MGVSYLLSYKLLLVSAGCHLHMQVPRILVSADHIQTSQGLGHWRAFWPTLLHFHALQKHFCVHPEPRNWLAWSSAWCCVHTVLMHTHCWNIHFPQQ